MTLEGTVIEHFKKIPDPRLQTHRNFKHSLMDILLITALATIAGADGWVEIRQFAVAKESWLRTFLELPNGIPSHDTFGRVFSLFSPEIFESCFMAWLSTLTVDIANEIIAIDGKVLRGSSDKKNNIPALHLVSAWAAKTRLMLGQVKTENKSNEITAIPKLIDMLDIKGATITIDAMGCQQKITQAILRKEGTYVLSLKENQKTLHDDVESIFAKAEENKQKQYKNMLHLRRVKKRKGHGRIETRKYTLVSARDPLFFALRWPGLKGIAKVDIKRTTKGKTEQSTRYFITNFEYDQIDKFIEAVEHHWQIEVDMHWSLDVSFKEDHSQIRIGNAPQNLAIMRRITLNLLKQESSIKVGVTCKRKTAGWDNAYLLKVLTADRGLQQFNPETSLSG
jgi:predicted transposase YbfD/YdcC